MILIHIASDVQSQGRSFPLGRLPGVIIIKTRACKWCARRICMAVDRRAGRTQIKSSPAAAHTDGWLRNLIIDARTPFTCVAQLIFIARNLAISISSRKPAEWWGGCCWWRVCIFEPAKLDRQFGRPRRVNLSLVAYALRVKGNFYIIGFQSFKTS